MSEENKEVKTSKALVLPQPAVIQEIWEDISGRSARALAALGDIKEIKSDEDDERAKVLIGKVKTTYETIEQKRKIITAPIDEFKKAIMVFEKQIKLDEKGSEAARVVALRNTWANTKLKQKQAQEAAIALDQNRKTELARLKGVFEQRFFENVMKQAAAMEDGVEAYYNSITLEAYEEQVKKFKITPKLKEDVWESWFIVDYDTKVVTADEFYEFLNQVKSQYTYESINALYVEQAQPRLDKWSSKLPELKKELEDLAALKSKNAEEAAKAQKAREEASAKDKEARNNQLALAIESKKDEVEIKVAVEAQNAAFEAQVTQQRLGDLKDVRKKLQATLTCDPSAIVQTLAQVLFACMTNPKWPGHIKKDKTTGANIIDENGRPEYVDWLEDILSFYATNCEAKVPGVRVDESVIAVTKRK